MQITKIKLTNFRNYENQTFNFSNNKNIIIGNNGVGKTNIVEAIYYLALTKSFRTNVDNSLVNNNQDAFSIIGTINDKISSDYKITFDKQTKKVYIDNNQIRKFSDYISNINIVCFNTEDLKLIKDSPSVHRQLINIEISQLDNKYLKTLSIYNKILKQRNTYLKNVNLKENSNKEFLYILTDKLIEYGLIINEIRNNFINNINKYLDNYFKEITGKEGLTLKYISDYNDITKEKLKKKYNKLIMKDINYGNTTIGIHLDDFIFYYQDIIAKNYLSEGEKKNAVIAFKLSEINIFKETTKTNPILILDDLFSELDKEKINKILNLLKDDMQIFITTTDLKHLEEEKLKKSKIFTIKEGKIEETIYG